MRVAFSLGSNLGDSLGILRAAVEGLASTPGVSGARVSRVFRTAPWGGVEQGDFLNVVVVADTGLGPEALLRRARELEDAHGRTRDVRWGPRTLDIDLLAVGAERRDTAELTLPHPRAHERAFVLIPWLDVDPDFDVPGRGTVRRLAAGVDDGGVRPITERVEVP